jgi:hypothetical protein
MLGSNSAGACKANSSAMSETMITHPYVCYVHSISSMFTVQAYVYDD